MFATGPRAVGFTIVWPEGVIFSSMMTYHVQFLLLVVAGWVNRQQQDVIDYLQEENRVLRAGCLRCLLLVMCTYPIAKKALTLHLARGEGRERYFDCNLMQRKVLASSHQHLMAEAPLSLQPGDSLTNPCTVFCRK